MRLPRHLLLVLLRAVSSCRRPDPGRSIPLLRRLRVVCSADVPSLSAHVPRARVRLGRVLLLGWLRVLVARCTRREHFQVAPAALLVEHRGVPASPLAAHVLPSEPVPASVHVLAVQVEHPEFCPDLERIRVA